MTFTKPIWIVSAKRTVQGRFLGALSKCSAVELGVAAGKAAMRDLDPAWIDGVIVGNVLSSGAGMNIARQIGILSGVPMHTPAYTVNMMCASGMHAVILAAKSIQSGDASMVLCGGTESMSGAPYLLERARSGYKYGDGKLVDSVLRDGLTDAFSRDHMGLLAERIATQYGIDREAQDADEGTIDPWLRTLSFWDGDRPICAVHSYAVHPMRDRKSTRLNSSHYALSRMPSSA